MDYLNIPNNKVDEKRVCHRTNFLREMMLKLDNGKEIRGTSNDVSLGGVSIYVEQIPKQITKGQTGELFILSKGCVTSKGFKCSISRISGQAIGIQIDRKNASSFGIAITQNLFKRKSKKNRDCAGGQ